MEVCSEPSRKPEVDAAAKATMCIHSRTHADCESCRERNAILAARPDGDAGQRVDDYMAALQIAEALYADSVNAHRWFAKHFGEQMNGRNFAIKCDMADRALAARAEAERELLEDLRHRANLLDESSQWPIGAGRQEFLADQAKALRAAVAKYREAK